MFKRGIETISDLGIGRTYHAKVIFIHENGTKKYFRIFRDARNFFSEIQGKKCHHNKEIYDFIKYKGSLNGWTAQLNIK